MAAFGQSVAREAKNTGYDPAIHHRRSIRLSGHDYADGGVYFVTLCVADRRPLFGTVVNGRMALNDAGRVAAACWRAIPEHFPQVALDEWIVMPDHVHGILRIGRRGMACHAPSACRGGLACQAPAAPKFGRPIAGALGTIIGAYKAATTRGIRRTGLACQAPRCQTSMGCHAPAPTAVWQRNYFDIIVRDDRALNNIRRYIRNNPAHWDTLRYGELRFFMGNRKLLDLPMTAFLASRGGLACWGMACQEGLACQTPTGWPVRPACVVGGFLSPMERAVFDACLADGIPVVRILARGLGFGMPNPYRGHGMPCPHDRLLIITPFDESVRGFSAARAAWCNEYALHLADNAVIGHLNPDGMLACLLADLRRDIPIHFLEPMEVGAEKRSPSTGRDCEA